MTQQKMQYLLLKLCLIMAIRMANIIDTNEFIAMTLDLTLVILSSRIFYSLIKIGVIEK